MNSDDNKLQSILHGLDGDDADRDGSDRAGNRSVGCPFVIDQLHASIEGELDDSTASFVESHVEQCAPCRLEKDRLQRERLELLESFVVAPRLPDRFAQKVVTAIRDAKANQQERARLLRRRFAVGLAAGLVLGAAIFGLALQTWMSEGSTSSNEVATVPSTDPSPVEVALPGPKPGATAVAVPLERNAELDAKSAARPRHIPTVVTLPVRLVEPETQPRTVLIPVTPVGNQFSGRLTLRAVKDLLGAPPCDVDVNLDGYADELDLVHMIIAQTTSSPVAAEFIAQFDCYDC